MDYDPGTFASLARSPQGRRLWTALNSDRYFAAMETATLLRHPAVKGIEEMLLQDFGVYVLQDRVKQMIGSMVRQIMEAHGYVIDQQKVKIGSIPFYAGTRYKRRDEWTYHVWRQPSDPQSLAITADKQGLRLPKLKGERWAALQSFAGALRGRVAFGLDDEARLRADIQTQGYHLHRCARLA